MKTFPIIFGIAVALSAQGQTSSGTQTPGTPGAPSQTPPTNVQPATQQIPGQPGALPTLTQSNQFGFGISNRYAGTNQFGINTNLPPQFGFGNTNVSGVTNLSPTGRTNNLQPGLERREQLPPGLQREPLPPGLSGRTNNPSTP